MREALTIETDVFEHRRVGPGFINPCCFGEDVAAWLRDASGLAARGWQLSAPIQEDYGWGFWASRDEARQWVAVSYVGDGPQEEPARFVVTVAAEPRGILRRLLGVSDAAPFVEVRDAVFGALRTREGVRVIEETAS